MTKPGIGGRPCEDPSGPMTVVLHIKVPDDLAARLADRAKHKRVSVSKVCRVMLERATR